MVLDSLSFDDAPDVDAPPANAPFADSDCYQKDNGTWSGGHTLARILANLLVWLRIMCVKWVSVAVKSLKGVSRAFRR
ncbi:hypothetical protein FOMPIDRAFT_1048246 [Fomitopsis schrenkii]|uniref:Uncharacterized protein n=1 Tax=Fomitopsis schrenkii TaxID=2126942 RepID=S8FUP2_FOMSC|nr:hypothetical protein FOMPIDRAFT_1048246 [Fomitopsis schrenkii]